MTGFLAAGYNGVTLFFVLSGFVLAWNYATRFEGRVAGATVWSFFVARFARVYPMYLVALALVALPLLVSGAGLPHIWPHVFVVQAWATDLGIAQGYNGVAWSVGVEFFLYACFPLLIVAMQPLRTRGRWLVGVALASVAAVGALTLWFHLSGRDALPWGDPGSDYRWLYREPVTRLGDFVLGICAAMLLALAPRRRPAWWGATAQAVGVVTILAAMSLGRMLGSVWSWDLVYMVPVVLLIVGLGLNRRTLLSRTLATKTAVLLGEASFAFYLLHHLMMGWLDQGPSDSFAVWLERALVLLLVISCTAVGAHFLVERPARTGLRRLLDRRPRSSSPTDPASSRGAVPTPDETLANERERVSTST